MQDQDEIYEVTKKSVVIPSDTSNMVEAYKGSKVVNEPSPAVVLDDGHVQEQQSGEVVTEAKAEEPAPKKKPKGDIAYVVNYSYFVRRKSDQATLTDKAGSISIVHSNRWSYQTIALEKSLIRTISKKIADDLVSRVANRTLHNEAVRTGDFEVVVELGDYKELHERVVSMEKFRAKRFHRPS